MTNWEKFASTPEKTADLLLQFNPNTRMQRPALKDYMRFLNNGADVRASERDRLIEWLKEEAS